MAHLDIAGTGTSAQSAKTPAALPRPSNGRHDTGRLGPAVDSLRGGPGVDHSPHLSERDWLALSQRLDISPQERKVVQGILSGQKLTVLADEMNVGLGTVKTYCQRVYHKLRISTHCELALAVLAAHRAASPDRESARVSRADDIRMADLMYGDGI